MPAITFRIVERDGKFVVQTEDGARVLGTHDTREAAEAQLRAIEANKAQALSFPSGGEGGLHSPGALDDLAVAYKPMSKLVTVNAFCFSLNAADGTPYDQIAKPGKFLKDGEEVEFNEEKLGQFVEGFAKQVNDLPGDVEHQACYVPTNGQAVPLAAKYDTLALVWDGKLSRFSTHGDAQQPDVAGWADGLYARRSTLTPHGKDLLENKGYGYISPTFVTDGSDEQGNSTGYSLLTASWVVLPFLDGMEPITFHRIGNPGAAPVTMAGDVIMVAIYDGATKVAMVSDDDLRREVGAHGAFLADVIKRYNDREQRNGSPMRAKIAVRGIDFSSAITPGAAPVAMAWELHPKVGSRVYDTGTRQAGKVQSEYAGGFVVVWDSGSSTVYDDAAFERGDVTVTKFSGVGSDFQVGDTVRAGGTYAGFKGKVVRVDGSDAFATVTVKFPGSIGERDLPAHQVAKFSDGAPDATAMRADDNVRCPVCESWQPITFSQGAWKVAPHPAGGPQCAGSGRADWTAYGKEPTTMAAVNDRNGKPLAIGDRVIGHFPGHVGAQGEIVRIESVPGHAEPGIIVDWGGAPQRNPIVGSAVEKMSAAPGKEPTAMAQAQDSTGAALAVGDRVRNKESGSAGVVTRIVDDPSYGSWVVWFQDSSGKESRALAKFLVKMSAAPGEEPVTMARPGDHLPCPVCGQSVEIIADSSGRGKFAEHRQSRGGVMVGNTCSGSLSTAPLKQYPDGQWMSATPALPGKEPVTMATIADFKVGDRVTIGDGQPYMPGTVKEVRADALVVRTDHGTTQTIDARHLDAAQVKKMSQTPEGVTTMANDISIRSGDKLETEDGRRWTAVTSSSHGMVVADQEGGPRRGESIELMKVVSVNGRRLPPWWDRMSTGAARAFSNGGKTMTPEVMARLGMAEGASDEEKKAAFAKFADECAAKMADLEGPDAAKMAEDLEGMAKFADEEGAAKMRKMAARFKKFAAVEEPPHAEPDGDEPAKMAVEEEKQAMAAMAKSLGLPAAATASQIAVAMSAKTVPADRLGAMERELAAVRAKQDADAAVALTRDAETFADEAIRMGRQRKDKRDVIVAAFKRAVPEAEALLFDKGTFPAPGFLTQRITAQGAPVTASVVEDDPNARIRTMGRGLAVKAQAYAKEKGIALDKAQIEVSKLHPELMAEYFGHLQ